MLFRKALISFLAVFFPLCVSAASMDGATMSVFWGLPFAALLVSIAFWPLLAPHFWHRHFGKITLGWSLAFLLPCAVLMGGSVAIGTLSHAALAEYVPFILLLLALYVSAGGICIDGSLRGTPLMNTGLLALGTVLASIMGTTGASMLLIRPLLSANTRRRSVVHIVIFFIYLVSNAGGALTPLGDPPLFLGFLRGVEFTWTLRHIFPRHCFSA